MKDKWKSVCINIISILCWVTIASGQCQEKSYEHADIVYNQRYLGGEMLTCKANIGISKCMETCSKTAGCNYLNYDSKMLYCQLMGDNNEVRTSDFQKENGNILVLMRTSFFQCEPKACAVGNTCVRLSSGRRTCVPIDRKCCEERFLVTGPHGVESSRVTFSSVYAYDAHAYYYLNSILGWAAGPSHQNANQWIQVLFYSRKFVLGVVTQGRYQYDQWVTSYQVRYIDYNGAWVYVRDTAGIIMTFPGNVGSYDIKVNYFPRPVSTTGIQLRPKTWRNYITLRFDVLGC